MNQYPSCIAMALLVLLAAACGPSGDPGPETAAGDSPVPALTDSSTVTPGPSGEEGELATTEQAIRRAEKDPTVQAFQKRCKERGFEVGSHAKFEPDQNQWIVVFYAEDVRDLFLEVHLSPEGESLSTKEGE